MNNYMAHIGDFFINSTSGPLWEYTIQDDNDNYDTQQGGNSNNWKWSIITDDPANRIIEVLRLLHTVISNDFQNDLPRHHLEKLKKADEIIKNLEFEFCNWNVGHNYQISEEEKDKSDEIGLDEELFDI